MKKNLELSKQLLERVLRELPHNYSLSNVRFHINRALNEIAKNEKKSSIKEEQTPLDRWKLDMETGTLINPFVAKMAMQNLNQMINQEKAKLEANKPIKNTTPTISTPNNSQQNVFFN